MDLEMANEGQWPEVTPALTPQEAVEEAWRCYFCYDAPCITACPTGIDIPHFIHHLATGDVKAAARGILDANILGATCARICPTEALCEGGCVRLNESRPVRIGALQRVATDWAMKSGDVELPALDENGQGSIGVLGAGPAGLSSAAYLARRGYTVDVYDRHQAPGGLDTYGIVSYREPLEVSLFEADLVKSLGVTYHLGIDIQGPHDWEEIRSRHDAIVIAVGMGRVPRLNIPGEDLLGVYDALDLIEATKTQPLADLVLGDNVIVVGAGNTAVDAATCAKRLGAQSVTIVYRRDERAMPAYPYEYAFAKQDGITYRWWTEPVAILGDHRVQGLRLVRTRVSQGDPADRRAPLAVVDNSDFVIPADSVIRAIGQSPLTAIGKWAGLRQQEGRVWINPQTLETSVAGVYASGDYLERGEEATVVQAVQDGKRVAAAIHRALAGRDKTRREGYDGRLID